MKTYQEMIKYFEGVKAQHEAGAKAGMYNPNSGAIVMTYRFVINKLEEWAAADNNSPKKGCPNCKDMILYLTSKNLYIDFIQSLGDKRSPS